MPIRALFVLPFYLSLNAPDSIHNALNITPFKLFVKGSLLNLGTNRIIIMKAVEIVLIAGLTILGIFLIVMAIHHPDKKCWVDILDCLSEIIGVFSD